MDQFKIILIMFLYLLNHPKSFIKGHQIELISAISIYPCLDTYDILVNLDSIVTTKSNSSIEANEMIELIRIYTTDNPRLHLRQYYYLKELKVPLNRLVKIDCNFFSPESKKYYCFSYVSMYKVNSSIAIWTQPECKLTLISPKVDSTELSSASYTSQSDNILTNANISTFSQENTNNPSKDNRLAISSPHGPSFTFISTTHEASTDYKKSDLEKSLKSTSALKLLKCRCNRLINYNLEYNYHNGTNLTHSNQFLLELFPCIQPTDPMCISNNSSGQISTTTIPQDLDSLCLLNLPQSTLKIQFKIVKSLSCNSMSTITNSSQSFTTTAYGQKSKVMPIIRNGIYSIDPQLEINSESTVTHQLTSSNLRVESTSNRYYLIHVTIINRNPFPLTGYDVHSQRIMNLFNSLSVFFNSYEPIWLALIALTSFIIISIIIFLCVFLIVPIRQRRSKVQIVLLDDLANTSTSFIEASSLEQFDFDESGSLEMDYYDLGMRSTRNNSLEKLSGKSIDSVIT